MQVTGAECVDATAMSNAGPPNASGTAKKRTKWIFYFINNFIYLSSKTYEFRGHFKFPQMLNAFRRVGYQLRHAHRGTSHKYPGSNGEIFILPIVDVGQDAHGFSNGIIEYGFIGRHAQISSQPASVIRIAGALQSEI
uniref:Uncharacterized protein n=1 Tax=Strigamia maritima TaxID=126957 RepID=T1J366_STRMM